MNTTTENVLAAVGQILAWGLPLYPFLEWRAACIIHASMIVLWVTYNIAFREWENFDFGVNLLILAILIVVGIHVARLILRHTASRAGNANHSVISN